MKFTIHLNIGREELMRYYRDGVQNVRAIANNGQVILFPVNVLRPFINQRGVFGLFEIECDRNGKLLNIKASKNV